MAVPQGIPAGILLMKAQKNQRRPRTRKPTRGHMVVLKGPVNSAHWPHPDVGVYLLFICRIFNKTLGHCELRALIAASRGQTGGYFP